MRRSRVLLVLLLTVVALSRCEFYDPKNLITAGDAVRVQRLRVTAANSEVVWEIERISDVPGLRELRLGEVPRGYRQNFPNRGRPRALRQSEPLAILRVSDTGITCHHGAALSPDSFRGGVWEAMPFNHPKNAEAEATFAKTMACSP